MKRHFEASGLLLVAVSGLTASNSVNATVTRNKEAADVGNVDGLKNVSEESVLDFVNDLDYGKQKVIYKDLTANKLGFFGKDLLDVRKSNISKDFKDLYKKDTKKFNTYIKDNYGLNLLVYDWTKDPSKKGDLDKLLGKMNENEKIKQEKAIKEGKTYVPKLVTEMDLINFPALALDYALEEKNSTLIPDCDKSIINEKIRENAKYIGVSQSLLNSAGGSLGIVDVSLEGNKSGQKLFRNVVTDTLCGRNTPIPTSGKIKEVAKEGAAIAGIIGTAYGIYEFLKRGYNKLFGKKNDESKKEEERPSLADMLKPFPD